MTSPNLMYKYILKIYDLGLITDFLINIFQYEELTDINYIFRISIIDNDVIIDLFDNISENRFNRYCFIFKKKKIPVIVSEKANVFVTKINVLSISKNTYYHNNLLKLAYLFKLSHKRKINYAKKFLKDDFVKILIDIMNDYDK